jgi:glycosyltransferase involved in cell wall biosynthesis
VSSESAVGAGSSLPIEVSVVIATYNGATTVRELLDALAEQESQHSFEVIVSDNGSTDETLAIADQFSRRFARLLIVDASDNRGVSHARNVGAVNASGRFLLFCDQDDVVAPGWLDAMAAALERHPFVAARLEHRRLNPAWTVRFYGEPQRDELPGASFFRPYAWGGSIGIRRELHHAVGGFDRTFREGGEDNDYCWRVQSDGPSLRIAPDAVLHYRHRQRLAEIFRQSRGYGRESAGLLKRYRPLGMEGPSQRSSLVAWVLLLPRLPRSLASRERRAAWVSALGWRVGRLQGSVRWRVLAL